MTLEPQDLLLAPRLDRDAAAALLRRYGFKDPQRADANLQSMAADPPARRLLARIAGPLLSAIGDSADPDQGLDLLERYAKAAMNEVQFYAYLAESPRTIELVAKVMGASPFMAEILIRDPGLLYWVSDPRVLDQTSKKTKMARDLSDMLRPLHTHERRLDALRIFKRRELLHIGVRDLLRLSSVTGTLESLSALADALISSAFEFCVDRLVEQHAPPNALKAPHARSIEFAVIGVGKLGGDELNFSSDVDLLFIVATDEGSSRLRRALSIPVTEFHRLLAKSLTTALSDVTGEGYVYRVDLRLRPEGAMGGICASLSTCREYYSDRADAWERLSLIKARFVAGDPAVARRFLKLVRPFVYGSPLGKAGLGRMRDIKTRIDRKIALRGESQSHVKLGFGGIREIEFVTQALQASHGQRRARLRERNTLRALRALRNERLLSDRDRGDLREAYVFLRDVENKLQMVLDFQTHTLPSEPTALRRCALRLGYQDVEGQGAGDALLADHQRHARNVNRVFRNVFDAQPARS